MSIRNNKRQHMVPQMMIRKFAGSDGKLFELIKPDLAIGTKPRAPKGILFGNDVYSDAIGNLDSELFQPIEQAFRYVYSEIANHTVKPSLSGRSGAAFIDWVASMLVRTRFTKLVEAVIIKENNPNAVAIWFAAQKIAINAIRIEQFRYYQDLLTRSGFAWNIITIPEDETFVLSDYPVYLTMGSQPLLIVPLIKRRLIIGGRSIHIQGFSASTEQLNLLTTAYADRSVFASNKSILEGMLLALEGKREGLDPEWCKNARLPFFGFLERLPWQQAPDKSTLNEWYTNHLALYGDRLLRI